MRGFGPRPALPTHGIGSEQFDAHHRRMRIRSGSCGVLHVPGKHLIFQVPVRLNLPPNPSVIGGEDAVMQRDTFGTAVAAAEIRLLGVPRSPGRLTITGYSCEVTITYSL